MNKRFEKIVVILLLLIAIRIFRDYRSGHEQQIIDSAMEFMGGED